ncbi:hypothetical protein LEP1GSC161_0337 [Leptospira santarosai str. CBC1416]|uniref:Uncharacterized protein n=1 Tax=Leptospira santarosai str. CBC1416 TaxID=1193059 RepID=M6VLR0_9LEPT|nr:hypothetical protein LEP1GSC161_0337 [Leptospira santarosai str. CBC1416]
MDLETALINAKDIEDHYLHNKSSEKKRDANGRASKSSKDARGQVTDQEDVPPEGVDLDPSEEQSQDSETGSIQR